MCFDHTQEEAEASRERYQRWCEYAGHCSPTGCAMDAVASSHGLPALQEHPARDGAVPGDPRRTAVLAGGADTSSSTGESRRLPDDLCDPSGHWPRVSSSGTRRGRRRVTPWRPSSRHTLRTPGESIRRARILCDPEAMRTDEVYTVPTPRLTMAVVDRVDKEGTYHATERS